MPVIRFTIPGRPRGKERPRTVPGHDRPYTPKDTVLAEREIRAIFKKKFPDFKKWDGPVLIRFTAIFETPRSFPQRLQTAAREGGLYFTGKPDKDNIEKLIADALNGVAWHDDGQVQGGGVKRYGSPERTDVVLDLIEGHPVTPSQDRRLKKSQEDLFAYELIKRPRR